jgi:hypothetical protein
VKFCNEFDLKNVNNDLHVNIINDEIFFFIHRFSTFFILRIIFSLLLNRLLHAKYSFAISLRFIFDIFIITSRNVRSSFSTSMHDRNASSHIELSNLMCVRCIKRLIINSRHIYVFRSNKKKCRYCHDQRHKCLSINDHLRFVCESLFTSLNAQIFLKYRIDF